MLKLNKKSEYALMALKFMAEKSPGELTSVREICDRFQIPFDTTAKVLQALGSHDIVNSIKGIKGGYTLTKDLSKISFMDMSRIVEGKDSQSFCMTHKGLCDLYGRCNITGPIDNLNRQVIQFLESLSLESLLIKNEFDIPQLNEARGAHL